MAKSVAPGYAAELVDSRTALVKWVCWCDHKKLTKFVNDSVERRWLGSSCSAPRCIRAMSLNTTMFASEVPIEKAQTPPVSWGGEVVEAERKTTLFRCR